MQCVFLSALYFANEKPDLMLYYSIGAAYHARLGSMTESKCAKALLMRLRSLTRKWCSVKIKLATRVQVCYTKTPMCELTRDSGRMPRSGAHWRRGTDVTLFLLSLWDTHQHIHNWGWRNMWHGDSLQLWKQGKDRDSPGPKYTIKYRISNKKNLTTSLASWSMPVVQHLGGRGRREFEASLGYRVRLSLQKEKDTHKL